ncbi:type VI secretion system protein TssL, short form [Enterobacter ludwigii]|uniref:type VI secretion system protein TssL, short form n=1 Tax=Enterobacter ludwigii TaxID=299767 RepID=UPI003BEEF1D4
MSDNPKPLPVDIDALLQDTWLQAISLRHFPTFKDGDAQDFWTQCVTATETVQRKLEKAGMDEASRKDILNVQCSLLDEVVKKRNIQDDLYFQWRSMPLQGHFIVDIDAGDALCSRMREVLQDPSADLRVLTCFHRAMMLGFLGEYPATDAPEREKLVRELTARVPPFRYPQAQPVLAGVKAGYRLTGWLSRWPLQMVAGVMLLAGLWWGLHHWLDQILAALLPGVVK